MTFIPRGNGVVSSSGTTNVLTFTGTVAPGDLIVLSVIAGSGAITSVVDSNSNSFALIPFLAPSGPGMWVYWLQVPAGSGGASYSVTVTKSGANLATAGYDWFTPPGDETFFAALSYATGVGMTPFPGNLPFTQSSALSYGVFGEFTAVPGLTSPFGSDTLGYDQPFVPGTAYGLVSVYQNVTSSPANPGISFGNSIDVYAFGVLFVSVSSSLPDWLDTFNAPNGTEMIGRFSDNGVPYANLAAQTLTNGVIESNAPYTSSDGSSAYAIAQVVLGINDPVQIIVNLSGNASTEFTGFVYRAQSGGSAYSVLFRLSDDFVFLELDGSYVSGFGPSAVFPADTYTLTAAPFGIIHNIYLANLAGNYYNPTTNSFQSDKIALFTVTEPTIQTAGSPGLNLIAASGDANTAVITKAQGGPSVMLPTDLGCKCVSDTFIEELMCLTSEGGFAPIVYNLQRKPGSGGSYATIATSAADSMLPVFAPAIPFFDTTVTVSTAYDYRVQTVDFFGNTQVSNVIAVTTLGAQTGATYTLNYGTITQVVNGAIWNDTAGDPINFSLFDFWWDQGYGMYFLLGEISSAGAFWTQMNIWASRDLMNWTNLGTIVTEFTGRSKIALGKDGFYYLLSTVPSDAGTQISVFRSSYPAGPYTAWSLNIPSPAGENYGDCKCWQDYDGTAWTFFAISGSDYLDSSCYQLNSTFNGYAGTGKGALLGGSGSPLYSYEGPAPFRHDRVCYLHTSRETDWAPNPNVVVMRGSHLSSTFYIVPNSNVYTTPAQALAAPAGAANGYESSQFGIDPALSYSTQSSAVCVTNTGQLIALPDRWNPTGTDTPANASPSAPVWLPITIGALGMPTIPFVSTFIPSSGAPAVTAAQGAILLVGA